MLTESTQAAQIMLSCTSAPASAMQLYNSKHKRREHRQVQIWIVNCTMNNGTKKAWTFFLLKLIHQPNRQTGLIATVLIKTAWLLQATSAITAYWKHVPSHWRQRLQKLIASQPHLPQCCNRCNGAKVRRNKLSLEVNKALPLHFCSCHQPINFGIVLKTQQSPTFVWFKLLGNQWMLTRSQRN